jgi:predicted transcriptional regulator YheO
MNNTIDEFKKIVDFLGDVLGNNCEVVLQDLRKGRNCIVAIANGHISGRSIGSPLTDLGQKVLVDGDWKENDYYNNYVGMTKQGKRLRSSTYFIKDNDKLIGMLCINFDESKFLELSEMLLKLGGINKSRSEKELDAITKGNGEKSSGSELFYVNTNDMVDSVIGDSFPALKGYSANRLTQKEKMDIVRKLDEKQVFVIKGAVGQVAHKLGISVASLYRYIAAISREKSIGSDDSAPKHF